ncbi:MAG: GTPase Era [Campylobacter sputorum]|uniref:GTPase Era n=1 Tax=Campylobacter sputorum TaxID=206 RepID=UPI000B7715B3|nr:GTPase Era [Campylobacter sputorum]ASM38533.1 GTP-binding protein [Campylobacter sputorum bv. paraureolyticus LMG 11764]MDY6120019.1 GTPase Era [Campylobacter sputorum]
MKSGFVSLVGRTNSGKSSLLNYLLNEKIAMVSHKINATRRKISGIVMHENNQIIFTDTPGLHESNKTLNSFMIDEAKKMIGDCDLILFLACIHDSLQNYEKFLSLERKNPHILVLTKIDEANDKKILQKITEYQKYQNEFLSLIPINTKKQIFKKLILDEICKFLPTHEYYYDPQIISTNNQKDIIRDLILEAVYENVSDEVPYGSDVKIDKIIEKNDITEIYATIYTDTKSHKSILIGKNGETSKRIGITSRKTISNFLQKKVFINLNIHIIKNWTKNINLIKNLNS